MERQPGSEMGARGGRPQEESKSAALVPCRGPLQPPSVPASHGPVGSVPISCQAQRVRLGSLGSSEVGVIRPILRMGSVKRTMLPRPARRDPRRGPWRPPSHFPPGLTSAAPGRAFPRAEAGSAGPECLFRPGRGSGQARRKRPQDVCPSGGVRIHSQELGRKCQRRSQPESADPGPRLPLLWGQGCTQ